MEENNTTYNNDRRYIFSNWSKEEFIGTWAGESTIIKAGETVELPEFKAYHFTKHFVNRELMRDGKVGSMDSPETRRPYEVKTVAEITAGTDSPALALLKEKIKEEIEIETGVKAPKKEVKKVSKKDTKEEVKEFEGIE